MMDNQHGLLLEPIPIDAIHVYQEPTSLMNKQRIVSFVQLEDMGIRGWQRSANYVQLDSSWKILRI